MATSLRDTGVRCLGLSGAFSVSRDLFGYVYGPPARPRSLAQQMTAMRGPSLNLSIIFVGHRDDFSGTFSTTNAATATFAVQRTRELYAQVGVGIRRLYWSYVPQGDVGGYTGIADFDEAEELTEDWSGGNDGVDAFFVQTIGDADGWSDVNGSCSKDDKGMSGARRPEPGPARARLRGAAPATHRPVRRAARAPRAGRRRRSHRPIACIPGLDADGRRGRAPGAPATARARLEDRPASTGPGAPSHRASPGGRGARPVPVLQRWPDAVAAWSTCGSKRCPATSPGSTSRS